MKKIALFAVPAFALVAASSAQAAPVSWRVQNSTTGPASPTYQNACAPINPALTVVTAGATSGTYQVNCGDTSAVSFQYTSGSKVCRFGLNSFYNPANPITGAPAYYSTQPTVQSSSGGARCTITTNSFSTTTGAYTGTVRIQ